jgi:hypothetical protein
METSIPSEKNNRTSLPLLFCQDSTDFLAIVVRCPFPDNNNSVEDSIGGRMRIAKAKESNDLK